MKKTTQAGFTLLEMTMVIAIFGVLTAITVYNYGAFNNQIILGNLAYEVAMQIREAQVLSLSVRGVDNDFETNYGVFFKESAGVGDTDNFIYFADKDSEHDGMCRDNSNGSECDCLGNDDECISRISFTRNIVIEDIFVSESDSDPLAKGAERDSVEEATITFHRPVTDAIINSGGSQKTSVAIILKSPDDKYKAVVVSVGGQISVKDYAPGD